MNKSDWIAESDVGRMLKFVRPRVSERKLRLFSCGCFRPVWKSLTLKPVRAAVETAERFADGLATEQELEGAHQKGVASFTNSLHRNLEKILLESGYAIKYHRLAVAANVAHPGPFQVKMLEGLGQDSDELLRNTSATTLRCVAGNPFRRVAFDPRWRTADVLGLGRAIYDDRAFDRLPLLADALMDAGCDHDDILAHCRSDGPHVRGCWVVDLVLGKE
jgi:hypothetical protein